MLVIRYDGTTMTLRPGNPVAVGRNVLADAGYLVRRECPDARRTAGVTNCVTITRDNHRLKETLSTGISL
jgi:hypothetical protein